jgi:hypothetical protein
VKRPLVLVVFLLVGAPCRADVILTDGNGNHTNININNSTGTMLATGVVGNTSTVADFTSTQNIDGNGGQAVISPTSDPTLNNVNTTIPGFSFTEFDVNPEDGTGTLTITVKSLNSQGNSEPDSTFTISLGNGNNRFGVEGTNGEVLTEVDISGANFKDFKQPRVDGVNPLGGTTTGGTNTGGTTTGGTTTGGTTTGPGPGGGAVTPEPASLLLWSVLGAGLAGFGARKLRRKNRQAS